MRPFLLLLSALVALAAGGWYFRQPVVDWYAPLETMPPFARAQWLVRYEPDADALPAGLATGPTEDEAEIQFRAACDFYRKRRFAYAGVAFREVVALDRERDDARRLMAISFLAAGEGAMAEPAARRLLRRAEQLEGVGINVGEATLLLAYACLQRPDVAAVVPLLKELAVADGPYQWQALRLLTQLPGTAQIHATVIPATPDEEGEDPPQPAEPTEGETSP